MKKLWGIRHVRWFILTWLVHRHAIKCARSGLGIGIPNQADLDHLAQIYRGET
jgi:hypothetical protein